LGARLADGPKLTPARNTRPIATTRRLERATGAGKQGPDTLPDGLKVFIFSGGWKVFIFAAIHSCPSADAFPDCQEVFTRLT
jgi:hypothetical protein